MQALFDVKGYPLAAHLEARVTLEGQRMEPWRSSLLRDELWSDRNQSGYLAALLLFST